MPRLVYQAKELVLTNSEVVLGRHRDNAMQIDDGKASRRHCRVFTKPDGTVWVEDLESANGTSLNSEELFSPRKLADGDQIIIGKASVRFFSDVVAEVEKTPAVVATLVPVDPKTFIDRVISGYRLISVIAVGHIATLYRAEQISLKRPVAVKIFNAEVLQRDPQFAERFLTEARRMSRILHPNVVQIHECGQDDGVLWCSIELVEGETLEDLITRDGRLAVMLALVVAEQIATGLQVAHANDLVHGEVNPANVMLSAEGKVKLLDVGLVAVLKSGRYAGEKAGEKVGGKVGGKVGEKKRQLSNPWYLSPECAKGETVTAKSDIYSLGCVCFHLLTGHPPFDDDSPKAILKAQLEQPIPNAIDTVPELPKKIDEVLHGMLSKNPEWRHASMEEVLTDLRAVREIVAKNLPKSTPRVRASGTASTEHALQAAVNLERQQIRAERVQQNHVRKFVTWITLLVVLWIAYSFSGISLNTLVNNHGHRAETPNESSHAPSSSRETSLTSTPSQPMPIESTSSASAAGERWKVVQGELNGLAKQGNWGAAELLLARTEEEMKKSEGGAFAQSMRLKGEQLRLDGEAWYRAQIAALPAATTAINVAPRLARLGVLRDGALMINRGDAESRYQELVTRLDQQLKSARRQARQAIEAGQPETLPAIAHQLEPWFVGSPLIGVYRQFDTLTKEAAAAKVLWRSDWPSTHENLLKAKGNEALAAGAVLLLNGQTEEARTLLMSDPALSQGALVRRREALFGREAAILTFNELGDLQFIETLQGDVRLQDSALTGSATEACGLAITVPVGGANWNAAMSMTLGNGSGQAVISCVKADVAEFLMRIEADKVVLKIHSAEGWDNLEPPRPEGVLKIRLASRGNTLQVLVNNRVIHETKEARIPVGSQLRLEITDLSWTLDDVQVVGE